MKRANKIGLIFIILVLLLSGSAFSQLQSPSQTQSDQNLLGTNSKGKTFSLFDPSRFKMSHSYSFSYFSSGKTSGSFGVYTSLLEYRISNPLSVTLTLNYLHQPLSVFHKDDLRIKDAVLPNFQLRYRPNDSFSFTINIQTFPYSYGLESSQLFWQRYEPYGSYQRER